MSEALVPVPTLDEIAADPRRAAHLPFETARTLLYRAMIVHNALLAPATTPSPASSQHVAPATVMLTPAQAARKFSAPKRLLLAHADKIPGTVRLSRKTILFNEANLDRWFSLRARAASTPAAGRRRAES